MVKNPTPNMTFSHIWSWILDHYVTIIYIYLTIIPRARVGYEVIDSQRGA